ncbi:MAG: DUF4474 domain-containing protein [Clostridiales bacterium]|nr:DUF4474 domain-containing protein [Clostridiales bacterium]
MSRYYYKNTVNDGFWIPFNGENEMIPMAMALYINDSDLTNNPFFTRAADKHWWLTGFKLGLLNPSDTLTMFVSLDFGSTQEAYYFYKENKNRGVDYDGSNAWIVW